VCQHIPALMLHQILHTTTLRCCIVMEQNDTMLRQLWLFMVKSRPHLILQECTLILAIECCTNWHGMVMHKSTAAEEQKCMTFRAFGLKHAISFLVPFGCAIQHSFIVAEGQMNVSMTRQPIKCDQGMRCLHFCNSTGGWWQEERAWLLGHH
jgi:hypothetical protein